MSVVEASIEIDAPPERVWAVVADPRNLPVWDRHVVEVDDAPPGGLETGSRYTAYLKFMGVPAHVHCEALDVRYGQYSRIRLKGVVDATVETTLVPLSEERTRLEHRVEYHFPGGPLGEFAGQSVRMLGAGLLLKHGMRAQKHQVEAATS